MIPAYQRRQPLQQSLFTHSLRSFIKISHISDISQQYSNHFSTKCHLVFNHMSATSQQIQPVPNQISATSFSHICVNIPSTNELAAKLDKSILLTVITVTNLKSSLNSQIHIASQECNFVLVFAKLSSSLQVNWQFN